jgi:hypothetical protein
MCLYFCYDEAPRAFAFSELQPFPGISVTRHFGCIACLEALSMLHVVKVLSAYVVDVTTACLWH